MSEQDTAIVEDVPTQAGGDAVVDVGDGTIPETAPADAPASTLPGDGADTLTAADDPSVEVTDAPATPPANEPEPEITDEQLAEYDPGAMATVRTEIAALHKQSEAVDAEFDDLEAQLKDGKLNELDVDPRLRLLTAKQDRINRKIQAGERKLEGLQKQEQGAKAATWKQIGVNYADVAKSPAEAATVLKQWWDEEVNKVVKANPGAHAEFVRGVAVAKWEQRITVHRAKAGKPNGAAPAPKTTQTTARQRLTPGSGATPAPSKPESAAEKARRVMGPLSEFEV